MLAKKSFFILSVIVLVSSICGSATATAREIIPILELGIPDTARVVDHDNGIYVVGTSGGDLYVIDEAGEYTITALGAGSIKDVRIEHPFVAVAAGSSNVLNFSLDGLMPVEQWRQPVGGQVKSVDISGDGDFVAYLSTSSVGVFGSNGTLVSSYSISGAGIVYWLDATDDMEYIAITAEVPPYGGTNSGVELYKFDGSNLSRRWGRVLINKYETTEVRISEAKDYVAVATSSGTYMNLVALPTGDLFWQYETPNKEQYACDGDDNLNYIIGANQAWATPYPWFILKNLGTSYEVVADGNMNGPINDLDSNTDASLVAFGSDVGEFILLGRRPDDTNEIILEGNVGKLIDAIEIGDISLLVGGEIFINLYAFQVRLTKVDDINDCVGPGDEITYTIDYNYPAGPNCCHINDVNIIDFLPAGVDFNSASVGGVYNPNSHTVTWNIGTISPGDANSFTLTVMVKYDGTDSTIKNYCELKGIRDGKEVFIRAYEDTPVCCSCCPTPDNGATDVESNPILSWSPGKYADKHDVYFGTDKDDVKNASRSEPYGVLVKQDLTSNPTTTYDIIKDIGFLEFDTTYYWRIDDVNMVIDPYIWKGRTWRFTTGRHLVVENFERYANATTLKTVWQKKPLAAADINAVSNMGPVGLIHKGKQAMALKYSNNLSRSEAYADSNGANSLGFGFNWRLKDVKALSLWFHGIPDLRGSESGAEPYTLTGDGSGIYNTTYDVFYYFYREKAAQVSGLVAARVDSIENTDPCAMAGVMLRDTLNPDSIYAATVVTPNNRVIFMYRSSPTGNGQNCGSVSGITFPQWVRIFRMCTQPYSFVAQHANDVSGSPGRWSQIGTSKAGGLGNAPTYLGLCVTSSSFGQMCSAEFSHVDINSPLGIRILDPDATKDVGNYVYNAPQPMYVVLQDNDSNEIVYYENKDANVTQTGDWTQWRIDINDFKVQGMDPCNVRKMYIGIGDKGTPSSGSGTMYIDDIRLYLAEFYEPKCLPLPADLVRDGLIDYGDLAVMIDYWLQTPPDPNINLYNDGSIDFKDFAEMAEHWGQMQVWPTW